MILEIRQQDAELIGKYLATRPWLEVNDLLLIILNLKAVTSKEIKDAPQAK